MMSVTLQVWPTEGTAQTPLPLSPEMGGRCSSGEPPATGTGQKNLHNKLEGAQVPN